MSFVAKVGRWPQAREEAVFAALSAWAFEDEEFRRGEVLVDILGGGPADPLVRMEADTTHPVIISGFGGWSQEAEARLRQRMADAGGEDVSLTFTFPDED